jgi:hypothetical protein
MNGLCKLMALSVLCVLTTGFANGTSLVVEFDSAQATLYNAPSDLTIGWSFSTNSSLSVTALASFDPSGTGLVQLYDADLNVLASATLTATDSQAGSPTQFYVQPITPVTLLPSNTYYIAEDVSDGTALWASAGTITVDPAISFLGAVSSSGDGQTPTDDSFGGAFDLGFFGPNFSTSTTPEPSTFLLALTGCLLGAHCWRNRFPPPFGSDPKAPESAGRNDTRRG